MGGDNAPDSQVRGAVLAAEERPGSLEVILVGRKALIEKHLAKSGAELSNLSVVNADDVVTMEDTPSEAFKTKPESSLNIALNLQKDKKADALISAGNTGAVLTFSTLKLGRIEGISRPTIGSIFPSWKDITMVIDVGATVDCRPNNLLEYAVMGSVYMNYIHNIDNPRIGLLSIGEEKSKGNELTFEAYKLLENSGLNFIGNVEGRDILKGTANVVVCDGFVGNVVLKLAESVLDLLKNKFRQFSEKSLWHKFRVALAYPTLKKIVQDFNYEEFGGVPLLGVNGVSIIGHGKSTPLAIKNMIFKAEETVRKQVNSKIKKILETYNK
ncbi:phosphate acyltransferase PlsX [bacterium]|nr:MAG: phosphate acyltransferase PlsX [bacterium]